MSKLAADWKCCGAFSMPMLLVVAITSHEDDTEAMVIHGLDNFTISSIIFNQISKSSLLREKEGRG